MKLKHLKIGLLLVAVTVVFIGCSKDDEPTVPNPLVGVWHNKYIPDDLPEGEYVFSYFIYTFNPDKTFVLNKVLEENDNIEINFTQNGTYAIYDKNKVIFHTTYDDIYESPNVDFYHINVFEISRDDLGEFVALGYVKFYRK